MSDRDEKGHFRPGNPGGPGRKKGSRNRLGEAFLEALADDFEVYGYETIERVRQGDPVAYVKVCASILPKELNVRVEDDLTDEQLDHRIRQLAAALDLALGDQGGTGAAPRAEEGKTRH
jgi:hypothetical protein